jgi:hypothetical protein
VQTLVVCLALVALRAADRHRSSAGEAPQIVPITLINVLLLDLHRVATRSSARQHALRSWALRCKASWTSQRTGCTSFGEQVALPRDELLDGLRGSAGDFLDRGGHAVIAILAM